MGIIGCIIFNTIHFIVSAIIIVLLLPWILEHLNLLHIGTKCQFLVAAMFHTKLSVSLLVINHDGCNEISQN